MPPVAGVIVPPAASPTHTAAAPVRNSIFDWLRLVGAVTVVLGHSWALLARPPLAGVVWHAHGLELFFLVSGYLITASWCATASPWRYVEKRARRIIPALVVVIALTTFVVGPLLTTVPDYFAHRQTWAYLVGGPTLPGLFTHNAYAVVNGSLWTIPVEAAMYALTPLFVRIGPWGCIALVVALKLHPLTQVVAGYDLALPSWIVKFFLIGAALRLWGARLPRLAVPALPVDLSYGLYLTAFPIQQTIIAFVPGIAPLALTISTLALGIPLAWLSWTFIEQPALSHALRGRPREHPSPL